MMLKLNKFFKTLIIENITKIDWNKIENQLEIDVNNYYLSLGSNSESLTTDNYDIFFTIEVGGNKIKHQGSNKLEDYFLSHLDTGKVQLKLLKVTCNNFFVNNTKILDEGIKQKFEDILYNIILNNYNFEITDID